MKTLGIIPARNGSKRIPQKHFEVIGGKRLTDWTLDAALASTLDDIIVSTDIPDLSNLYQFALQAPERRQDSLRLTFLERPPGLAEDNIHAVEVVLDILESRYTDDIPYDVVMMLLPTSPFRTPEDIDAVLGLMASGVDAVIGVQKLSYPDIRLRYIDEWGFLEHPYYDSDSVTKNSQECDLLYLVNGAIFAANPVLLLRFRTFHVGCAVPYLMPPERSIEIDTPEDLALARGMCAEDER